MKISVVLGLFLLIAKSVFGQINMEDSTVQVIGYWDNHEKQLYSVSLEKYKIKDSDTTSREMYTYDLNITITDSTATSYTIEWYYKNFKIDSDNKLTQRLASIAEDCKVVIKTTEMGAFVEVVNWKEVNEIIKKAAAKLKKEFKDVPKIDDIVKQVAGMFASKEAIEAAAIKDIQQFYSFHGGKYKLGEELSGQLKYANLLGGEPFDGDVTVMLDEIDTEDDNALFRMWQTINSQQLTDATYEYLKKSAATLGVPPLAKEDMKPIVNETRSGTWIHGPSGWPVYSVETKEVSSEEIVNVEERIIEIK